MEIKESGDNFLYLEHLTCGGWTFTKHCFRCDIKVPQETYKKYKFFSYIADL